VEGKIVVVGIGPGHPDYLLPIAAKIIASANVIVGGKRALETLAPPKAWQHVIDKNIEEAMNFIARHLQQGDVVVMVSGDPGFYSLLTRIRRSYTTERVRVIPGISSLQLAFARFALPWQDAQLVSLHGRCEEEVDLTFEMNKTMGFLTDSRYRPQVIAQLLMDNGWPADAQVYLAERLSYADEQLAQCTLQELSVRDVFAHGVMVVAG